MRILVVDDERLLVKGIRFNLENEGYEVDAAYDGEEALALFNENVHDLIVLDLMLPKVDGLEVCRRVREKSNVPIIMLTARSGDTDKLLGFEYGADDYLAKPFNILELKARIRAVARRVAVRDKEKEPEVLSCPGFSLYPERRCAVKDGREVDLTAKEFDLAAMLMKNPGRVFSREQLLNIVWGYEFPGDIRTVDVHVRRLREKLEQNPAEPRYILTKWGVGYYYQPKE